MTADQPLLIALWKDELEQLEVAYKQALIRSKNEEQRLVALVVSERERADKALRDRAAMSVENVSNRGIARWAREDLLLERARAVRAETALREIANLDTRDDEMALEIARAALAGGDSR